LTVCFLVLFIAAIYLNTRQHRSDIDVNFIFTNLSFCQQEFIFKIIYRDNYFNLCSSDNKYYVSIKEDDKELDNEY